MGKQKLIQNVTVEGVAGQGKCIAHHEDKVLFVRNSAPGDVVDVRIVRKRKKFLEGVPVHFHNYSEMRQEPFCQHFDFCGGCKWQHLPYHQQLTFKRQEVIDSLQRIAKMDFPEVKPVLASAKTRYYRNKLEFTFSNNKWASSEEINGNEEIDWNGVGFHLSERFDKILDLEVCYLQPEPSNQIRDFVKAFARQHQISFYDLKEHRGCLRNLVIRTANTGEVMIIVQFGEDQPEVREALLAELWANFELTSLYQVVNPKKNDTFNDLDVRLYQGKPYLLESLSLPADNPPVKLQIGPKSFYQTNSGQAEVLYSKVLEIARLDGSQRVYDLYSGAGSISCFLARFAAKVIGIEYVPEAVEDACQNALFNELENTVFYAGDMKDIFTSELVEHEGEPDLIILDPPRAGVHTSVIERLMEIAPPRIIYVSCNPGTQARDIALMASKYQIEQVQPVDMFPHTYHIENIVELKLKSTS